MDIGAEGHHIKFYWREKWFQDLFTTNFRCRDEFFFTNECIVRNVTCPPFAGPDYTENHPDCRIINIFNNVLCRKVYCTKLYYGHNITNEIHYEMIEQNPSNIFETEIFEN